jgi:hypothetical protein
MIWGNITAVNKITGRLASRAPVPPGAGLAVEVAVFAPSTSAKTRNYDYMYDEVDVGSSDFTALQFEFAVLGAPVRWYYLEQLPTLPQTTLDAIKLAVILSPTVLSDELAKSIKLRLATDNRTVVYTSHVGLKTTPTAGFNLSRAAGLTGMPSLRGHDNAVPVQTKLIATSLTAFPNAPHWSTPLLHSASLPNRVWEGECGNSWGGEMGVSRGWLTANQSSPWWSVGEEDTSVAVLGRFDGNATNDGLASVAWRDNGDHKVLYSGYAWLPRMAWRTIAETAGVHMYVDGGGKDTYPSCPICNGDHSRNITECPRCIDTGSGTCMGYGDVAVASGTALMIHAGATLMQGPDKVREVKLPCAAKTVVDEAGAAICNECSSFNTVAMEAGDVLLYEIDIAC